MPSHTYCLFIDTCTERSVLGIGVLGDESQVVHQEELPVGLQSSKFLIPRIEAALEEAGIASKDLSAIAVGQGPGSYTGIRVGVSVAKALAYALKIPLIAVPTLCGFVPEGDGAFAVAIDARVSGVYLQRGVRHQGLVTWEGEPEAVPLDSLSSRLKGIDRLVTPQAQRLRPRAEEATGRTFEWIEMTPSVHEFLKVASAHYAKKQYSTDATCEILYLRKTQAEIEREGK